MKNSIKTILICSIAVLILLTVGFLVFESGLFSSEPAVEAKADNSYEETLRVITDIDYSPYSFIDGEGNPSGHDVELIAMIANELHMNLELKLLPWNEGIEKTVRGECDVLMTCDYSDSFEGVDSLLKTEPVSTDEFIVYSKKTIKSSDELYSMKCAVMENGNVLSQIDKMNLDSKCVRFKDNREAMNALYNDEVDCAVMRHTVGEALLKEENFSGISATISIGQSYMCFGISDMNTELKDKVNGAIETLKLNGEIEKLQKKWLTTFIHTYSVGEVIVNNFWALVVFAAVLLCILIVFVSSIVRRNRMEKEKNQYMEIVENLANDFECVNYVELRGNRTSDEAKLIRTSDVLIRNIPEWKTETNMSKRFSKFCETVVIPEDRERFSEMTNRDVILANLKEDGTYFVNFRVMIDGEEQYYQLKTTTIPDENGEIRAIVFGFHNVDETIRHEMENREKLEQANKSKTDFLFNMSHDIRTPMNAIIGFTQLAKKHIDDRERVCDSLSKIESSGNHLLNLINEVLDMSRVEAGKLHSEMKTVNVTECATRLVSICKESAAARNISLSFREKNIIHPVVIADELHVNQVIMNILGNAVKYTEPGGSVVYTAEEIWSDVPGYGKYLFTVEDTGIGMSEEYLSHIFESFSREENASTSKVQGTGLGMSIVKRLVDYMDGNIEIESKRGKGTKVEITLHLKIASFDDEASEKQVSDDVSFAGKRILLVEDNELNREIASDILQDRGIEIEEAFNGIEAVEQVKKHESGYYDFVLMDIQMPMMNGFEATSEIRKLPGTENLRIIALSANAFEEDRKKSIESGMDEHIAKPINEKELFGVLGKFV